MTKQSELERLAAVVRDRDALVREAENREREAHAAWKRAREALTDAVEARNRAEGDLVKEVRGERQREIDEKFNRHF